MADLFLKWPNVRISDKLTDTEFSAVRSASADLQGATLAGDTVTVASQAIDTHQLNEWTVRFNITDTYGMISRSSLADDVVNTIQGRATIAGDSSFILNTTADSTYDTLFKDSSGPRLIYLEDETNNKFVGVMSIASKTPQGPDENGEILLDVMWENSGRKKPVWF